MFVEAVLRELGSGLALIEMFLIDLTENVVCEEIFCIFLWLVNFLSSPEGGQYFFMGFDFDGQKLHLLDYGSIETMGEYVAIIFHK